MAPTDDHLNLYEDWKNERKAISVPHDFSVSVMHALPERAESGLPALDAFLFDPSLRIRIARYLLALGFSAMGAARISIVAFNLLIP